MTSKIDAPSEGAWTFDNQSVAKGFDAHVREQLPWYEMATAAVVNIARHYIPQDGRVYDVGASTGNVGRAIAPILAERNAHFTAIEKSKEMASQYAAPYGNLVVADAIGFPYEPFDLGVVFLSTIFMPITERAGFLKDFHARLNTGGAIVVVERMEAGNGYPATISSRLTLANKLASGATPDEIIAKELSLSGVQRPLRVSELPAQPVEFFRMGDFAGYIMEAD